MGRLQFINFKTLIFHFYIIIYKEKINFFMKLKKFNEMNEAVKNMNLFLMNLYNAVKQNDKAFAKSCKALIKDGDLSEKEFKDFCDSNDMMYIMDKYFQSKDKKPLIVNHFRTTSCDSSSNTGCGGSSSSSNYTGCGGSSSSSNYTGCGGSGSKNVGC
jgi:uncharacterized membrane protein YgcG